MRTLISEYKMGKVCFHAQLSLFVLLTARNSLVLRTFGGRFPPPVTERSDTMAARQARGYKYAVSLLVSFSTCKAVMGLPSRFPEPHCYACFCSCGVLLIVLQYLGQLGFHEQPRRDRGVLRRVHLLRRLQPELLRRKCE